MTSWTDLPNGKEGNWWHSCVYATLPTNGEYLNTCEVAQLCVRHIAN